MNDSKRIKSLFITYFDGCYGVDPTVPNLNTFVLGVCKLEFNEVANILTVSLRRPGLLIGKGGRTIDALSEFLLCTVHIKEINLLTNESKS